MAWRTGNPRAKSLDWVQKIAYSADLAGSAGWERNRLTKRTMKKMTDLARVMEPRKTQLTLLKSSWHMETKMSAGREKLPMNVPIPLDSTSLMMENLPAMKPRRMIPKHWTRAG